MPQMKPYNWINLSICMYLMFLIFLISLYFNYFKLIFIDNNLHLTKMYNSWKWMW